MHVVDVEENVFSPFFLHFLCYYAYRFNAEVQYIIIAQHITI